MGKYINPFTDWGFKKIFGQEANKDILIFFLNQLLQGEHHVEDISFLDKEHLGERQDDRSLIYDIYCKTSTGERIIVEMQNKSQANFIDRSIYYLSKSVVEQAEKGHDWKYKIAAVYGVFFMNFHDSSLDEKLRTDMVLADRDTNRMLTDKLRFIYLQLPFFDKKEDECENLFECFIYVLKRMEGLKRMPFEKKNFIFSKLDKIAEVRKLTEDERVQYDASLKHYWDSVSVFDTAMTEGHAKGFAEGKAEGLMKGRAEGRAEGRVAGRAEGILFVAKKMKDEDLPLEQISLVTGLSIDEIATL